MASKEKNILITGITGQDGSYLADLLLKENKKNIIGITRDPGARFSQNIKHLEGKIELRYCAYDHLSVIELVKSTSPECIYNFAGQTYVAKSWEMLDETMKSSGLIPSYFLDAIVKNDLNTKFFQASSSEIYFPEDGEILTEESPLSPRNPYGCSKSFAHNMVKSYRNRYGMFAVNGILFNHESPRRDANFLSKKIIQSAIKIKLGLESSLTVGNINVSRDWGYAPDYVEGIFRMMQMKEPEDIIFSTGIACTVDSMIKETFKILDLDYEKHVKVDEKLFRPFEAKRICGSNKKASALIGWAPTTDFKTMIMIMIDHELNMTSQSKKNE